jgi:hypothetical protein
LVGEALKHVITGDGQSRLSNLSTSKRTDRFTRGPDAFRESFSIPHTM